VLIVVRVKCSGQPVLANCSTIVTVLVEEFGGYHPHQENPYFTFCAFLCFFMLFHAFCKNFRKSTKKPSHLLARVLSEVVKKVDCLQKYFSSKSTCISTKVQPKVQVRLASKMKVSVFVKSTNLNCGHRHHLVISGHHLS